MIWRPARRITQVNDLREAAGLIRLNDAPGITVPSGQLDPARALDVIPRITTAGRTDPAPARPGWGYQKLV